MPETRPHARDSVKVLITMLPAELAELDALATELAEPGRPGNRSATVRALLDHWHGRAAAGRFKTTPRRPTTKGR